MIGVIRGGVDELMNLSISCSSVLLDGGEVLSYIRLVPCLVELFEW